MMMIRLMASTKTIEIETVTAEAAPVAITTGAVTGFQNR